MRQIILDTETTGLEYKEHRLIEIAGLEMVNRKLTGKQCHFYINPQRDIDAGAQRVHGISIEMLQDKPIFAEIAEEFLQFVEGAELIIHNAPFDLGFLNHELALNHFPRLDQHISGVLDTYALAKQLRPGKKNSLDMLCDVYGVDRTRRTLHGALIDCALLADVYLAMTRGQESLIIEMDHPIDHKEMIRSKPRNNVALKIIRANEEELAAHENYLTQLDKKSSGSLWRTTYMTASEHITS